MTQIREFDKVNVESVGVGLLIYLEEDKGGSPKWVVSAG
jgi:hypothetical protein